MLLKSIFYTQNHYRLLECWFKQYFHIFSPINNTAKIYLKTELYTYYNLYNIKLIKKKKTHFFICRIEIFILHFSCYLA